MTEARAQSVLDRMVKLSDLLDRESFQELCRSYVDLYGIGLKVFDTDGGRLVDIKVGNGDFCGYVYSQGDGRNQCTNTVREVKDTPFDGFELAVQSPESHTVFHPCFTGLEYAIVPILYQGDVLGKVILGPYRPADLNALPETVTGISPDFDVPQATRLVQKVQQAPRETVQRVVSHFRSVIDVVVHSGYRAHLASSMQIETMTETHRELAEKNQRLQDNVEKLRELDRLKSNFLATVSHELRTPLTSVIGYSEMLIEGLAGDLSPEQLEYITTIMEKGENLLALITSILDISKIESGQIHLQSTQIDLHEVSRAAITTVVPQAKKKNLQLIQEIADDLPRLPADKDKIRQVLINLLGNAVKFTPSGGAVTLSVERYSGARKNRGHDPASQLFEPQTSHFVRFSVRDSGIGIPDDKVDRIFDTFYQVDNSSTREYGGTGLGLSIVKSYIDAHGGDIWVESTTGEGSTFSFILPIEGTTGVDTGLDEDVT